MLCILLLQKNSHNREHVQQQNSERPSTFLAYPKQSSPRHSWGNNLPRPLPLTLCSPRYAPKTPQNSRLILLPWERRKHHSECDGGRVQSSSAIARTKSSSVILLIGESVTLAGQLIKQWKERFTLVSKWCSAGVHIPYMSNKVAL